MASFHRGEFAPRPPHRVYGRWSRKCCHCPESKLLLNTWMQAGDGTSKRSSYSSGSLMSPSIFLTFIEALRAECSWNNDRRLATIILHVILACLRPIVEMILLVSGIVCSSKSKPLELMGKIQERPCWMILVASGVSIRAENVRTTHHNISFVHWMRSCLFWIVFSTVEGWSSCIRRNLLPIAVFVWSTAFNREAPFRSIPSPSTKPTVWPY